MGKLQDMFNQARRGQSGGGIGFLGKSKADTKPRAAAIVVEFTTINTGSAEAAMKAGADSLLFTWDGKDVTALETLKKAIDAAKASNDSVVCGLHITNGWEKITREQLEQFKERGVNYIVLSLNAPARLLALHIKDMELVVTVPMRDGDLYPIFMRNLTVFDTVAAVRLDFGLSSDVSKMSIEDVLRYRAVREAVRFPALLNVKGTPSEADAFTLATLGVQAVVLAASTDAETARQIKTLYELLGKVYQDEKEKSSNSK